MILWMILDQRSWRVRENPPRYPSSIHQHPDQMQGDYEKIEEKWYFCISNHVHYKIVIATTVLELIII